MERRGEERKEEKYRADVRIGEKKNIEQKSEKERREMRNIERLREIKREKRREIRFSLCERGSEAMRQK